MDTTSFALALGSNRGRPRAAIARALNELARSGVTIVARSRIFETEPLGPAVRRFANAAAIVETTLAPEQLLALCKTIEARLGRKRGRRWGDRAIDIDIVLWSEGAFAGAGIVIPHPAFRVRRFVLDPLVGIAGSRRDPVTGLSVRQLATRLARARPVDRTTFSPLSAGPVGPVAQ